MTTTESVTRPPLESGDRLSRAEFERRYACRPDIKKAELIEGVVYVASPVRVRSHGQPHMMIMTWLGNYVARTPGTFAADNTTIRLDADNELQPDAFLAWDREHRGQAQIDEDDYLNGAPELIVEVAASSASYDLHDKMRVYRRNGVREYIVWQMLENKLDWFRLKDGEYVTVQRDSSGRIESDVFPGLRLDVPKLLANDLAGVLAALEG